MKSLELITSQGIPLEVEQQLRLIDPVLLGQVSHGFVDSESYRLKHVADKPVFRPLGDIIADVMCQTGRFFDIKIFNGASTLKPCNRPFYILADQDRQYF
jgi:hypothetical protein